MFRMILFWKTTVHHSRGQGCYCMRADLNVHFFMWSFVYHVSSGTFFIALVETKGKNQTWTNMHECSVKLTRTKTRKKFWDRFGSRSKSIEIPIRSHYVQNVVYSLVRTDPKEMRGFFMTILYFRLPIFHGINLLRPAHCMTNVITRQNILMLA